MRRKRSEVDIDMKKRQNLGRMSWVSVGDEVKETSDYVTPDDLENSARQIGRD